MELPLFYAKDIAVNATEFVLDEGSSRHGIKVLRLREGDKVLLTDGMGYRFTGIISDTHRKSCRIRDLQRERVPLPGYPFPTIGISLPRHTPRLEWFLEKAVEVGVSGVFLLESARSSPAAVKISRLRQIMISAMLQSRQFYLPFLHPPAPLQDFPGLSGFEQGFIAHCGEGKRDYLPSRVNPGRKTLVLIGPEGDFTEEELNLGLASGLVPVSLGDSRLRTETAGLAAALMIHTVNLLHKS